MWSFKVSRPERRNVRKYQGKWILQEDLRCFSGRKWGKKEQWPDPKRGSGITPFFAILIPVYQAAKESQRISDVGHNLQQSGVSCLAFLYTIFRFLVNIFAEWHAALQRACG